MHRESDEMWARWSGSSQRRSGIGFVPAADVEELDGGELIVRLPNTEADQARHIEIG